MRITTNPATRLTTAVESYFTDLRRIRATGSEQPVCDCRPRRESWSELKRIVGADSHWPFHGQQAGYVQCGSVAEFFRAIRSARGVPRRAQCVFRRYSTGGHRGRGTKQRSHGVREAPGRSARLMGGGIRARGNLGKGCRRRWVGMNRSIPPRRPRLPNAPSKWPVDLAPDIPKTQLAGI